MNAPVFSTSFFHPLPVRPGSASFPHTLGKICVVLWEKALRLCADSREFSAVGIHKPRGEEGCGLSCAGRVKSMHLPTSRNTASNVRPFLRDPAPAVIGVNP